MRDSDRVEKKVGRVKGRESGESEKRKQEDKLEIVFSEILK